MACCAVVTVMCFRQDKGQRIDPNRTELSQSEIVTLVCGVLFFLAFFMAMYVEVKARTTIYRLFVKFIYLNQQWYIDEYDKKDSQPVHVWHPLRLSAHQSWPALSSLDPNSSQIIINYFETFTEFICNQKTVFFDIRINNFESNLFWIKLIYWIHWPNGTSTTNDVSSAFDTSVRCISLAVTAFPLKLSVFRFQKTTDN